MRHSFTDESGNRDCVVLIISQQGFKQRLQVQQSASYAQHPWTIAARVK